MHGMRKPRENKHNRVYHLISRIAHRAFFLSADGLDRFIDVMKRSAAFSGVSPSRSDSPFVRKTRS